MPEASRAGLVEGAPYDQYRTLNMEEPFPYFPYSEPNNDEMALWDGSGSVDRTCGAWRLHASVVRSLDSIGVWVQFSSRCRLETFGFEERQTLGLPGDRCKKSDFFWGETSMRATREL